MRQQPLTLLTLVIFSALFVAPTTAQNPLDILKEKGKEKAFEKAASTLLNDQLPVKLDAKTTFPTVNAPPGGPFAPQPMTATSATLDKRLPPGDYTVKLMAYCTEYSVHRPGRGVAYKLAPLQGKASGAVANLLWRGTLAGVPPQQLQNVAWGIQSGLTYARLPKPFQAMIDRLIPDYKYQLYGDFVQQIEDTYSTYANQAKLPPLDALLAKMGKPGELTLAAKRQREILLAQNTSDEVKQQTLFAGQESGVYTPVNAQEGPWTVRIPGVAYMRYKIEGGNLQDNNILEVRIMASAAKGTKLDAEGRLIAASFDPQNSAFTSNPDTSLLSLLGAKPTNQGIDASGVIGYPVGQGAQDLIPVIAVGSQPPKVQLEIYDTADTTDDIVLLHHTIEAEARLLSSEQNDINITITSSGIAQDSGQVSLSPSTLTLPRDGKPVRFTIKGEKGSSSIGDVEIDAMSSGKVLGVGHVTVCFFVHPTMTITPVNPYIKSETTDTIGLEPEPMPAVTLEAHADLMPNALKPAGPLTTLYFGIVQNVESQTTTYYYGNPRIDGPAIATQVNVPASFTLKETSRGGWNDTTMDMSPLYDQPQKANTIDDHSLQPCCIASAATSRDSPHEAIKKLNTPGRASFKDSNGKAVVVIYTASGLSIKWNFRDWAVLYDKPTGKVVQVLCSSSWSIDASTLRTGSKAVVQNSNTEDGPQPIYSSKAQSSAPIKHREPDKHTIMLPR
ncbi:MAG TPA: hypothetical protein VI685_10580 [Candidatus Angelobacter sp.]